jgi:hypothetical protein
VATGLLQHESRLSVLNFAVRKAAAFADPLPNKAPLLFVTGLRCAPAGGCAAPGVTREKWGARRCQP